MRKLLIVCALLWIAFAAVGISMHKSCAGVERNRLGWVDIAGYDTEALLTHYVWLPCILEISHRHPLIGVAMSPIIVLGGTVAQKAGPEAGYAAVIACFALMGAACFFLIWLLLANLGAPVISRVAVAVLWLSFAHVWILGGIAESFGASMLILLGTLLMVACQVKDVRAWFAVSVLAGGVTVTNGIKPFLVWLAVGGGWGYVRKLPRKLILMFFAGCLGFVLLAALGLAIKWTYVDGFGIAAGLEATIHNVTDCFPEDNTSMGRLWLIWNAFWCEPMMLHEPVIGKSCMTVAYRSVLPHLVGAAVLGLCVWSAIRNFARPVIRAALLMVSFDVALHVILGWGAEEGQIYCGHWFWLIPLLLGLLPKKASVLIAALAVFIAAHNLSVIF